MDLIPLDASLVKGSHGVIPKDQADWPILCGPVVHDSLSPLEPTDVFSVIRKTLLST
jgi:hypothetical protein